MQNIKQHIKAVIFDMDGTIIQTEPLWDAITLQTLDLCNIKVQNLSNEDTKYLKSLSGAGFLEALAMLKQYFMLEISFEHFVAQTKEIAQAVFETPVAFVDGFENFQLLLQEHKIPLGLATNAHRENLNFLADKLAFHRFFGSHIYASSDVGNRAKPDPALFLHTAQQLGVKPDECIVFEDSLYGFKAAQAAGMPCIAVAHHRNTEHINMAQGIIYSYSEAKNALELICKTKEEALLLSQPESI